ncbi:hypothetical protein OQA88_12593 [Cercophora sp. LCS_1]
MQLSTLTPALLALLPAVSAGYSYGGGSSSSGSSSDSSSTSSGSAAAVNGVTVINVGKTPLKMEPSSVNVPQGEIIEFHFFSGAHSVAQSAFDSPCTPLNATAGFFSGPQRVSSGEGSNVFRVVSTGQPMWYYCATGQHCQGGMVGVINPPSNGARTIQQYTAAAAGAAQNVAPAAVQGGEVAAAGSAVTTGTSTGTSPTRTPGSAGVSSLGSLSIPVLGFAVAVAALMSS